MAFESIINTDSKRVKLFELLHSAHVIVRVFQVENSKSDVALLVPATIAMVHSVGTLLELAINAQEMLIPYHSGLSVCCPEVKHR